MYDLIYDLDWRWLGECFFAGMIVAGVVVSVASCFWPEQIKQGGGNDLNGCQSEYGE